MKLLILTKKNLIAILFCVLAGALASTIAVTSTFSAVSASATNRVIPIYCVDTQEKVVSISFDAAWGNEQTNTLLDILDKYNVKTTFFLVGDWVRKYPDSVKEIAKRGHDIGNHSNTHPHMTQLSQDKMTEQLSLCNEEVKKLTGKCPTLFRPPYGDYNNQVVGSVKSSNMYCVQWDVDSLDWKDPTPDQMVSRITGKIKNGSIVLLHNGAKNTPEALPKIIEAIQKAGYKIVPISQILVKGDYTTDHEGKMHCATAGTSATTVATTTTSAAN